MLKCKIELKQNEQMSFERKQGNGLVSVSMVEPIVVTKTPMQWIDAKQDTHRLCFASLVKDNASLVNLAD